MIDSFQERVKSQSYLQQFSYRVIHKKEDEGSTSSFSKVKTSDAKDLYVPRKTQSIEQC